MKASYNWIKDFCSIDLPVNDLADKLTSIGLVVEEIKQVDDDYCLDIEITANRPDCLGIVGIARELRAITGCSLQSLDNDSYNCDENVNYINVNVQDKSLSPRYSAQVIKNVKTGPSPDWLQKRLSTIGVRSINNVVDITNYVMFETGQPLHAFDLDKLEGNEIVIRNAVHGEKIVAIDSTNHTLQNDMLIIADSKKPIAIAGVMGGIDTEVSDNTKNILLECARFEPTSVRKASKRLGLFSDSSYRFERGIDTDGVLIAAKRAAGLIEKIAGGNIVSLVDKNYETQDEKIISMRIDRVSKVLGVKIKKEDIKIILERLGFPVIKDENDTINVKAPSYRNDVYREIDLIEEIIRIYGYDKIPIKTDIKIGVTNKKTDEKLSDNVRHLLAGFGMFEVVTFSIVEEFPTNFDVKVWSEYDNLTIKNPLVQTEKLLRKTLLFNFLKIKRHNQNRGINKINIFEISNIYLPINKKKLVDEKKCLSILFEKSFLELKGVLESLIYSLCIKEDCSWNFKSLDFFSKEESAIVMVGDEFLGFIGKINKELCDFYELNGTPCFAELDFDLLTKKSSDNSNYYKELPNFPSIIRDVAIVVDETVKWSDVQNCVKSANVSYFEGIEFFDIYRGKQVDGGKKSIAFSVKFRTNDRTLKGEEADDAIKTILTKLDKDIDAKIRK